MREKLYRHNWKELNNWECKYKRIFLKKLSTNKSSKILENLYKFAQKVGDTKNHNKMYLRKMRTLTKVHSIFMKVNP